MSASRITIMPLANLAIPPGQTVFYQDNFRNTLEDFVTLLRNDSTTSQLIVTPIRILQFKFDFFGLLAAYNIPIELHYLTMRMNYLTSPQDDIDYLIGTDNNPTPLLIPSSTRVNNLAQSYQTVPRIS